MTTTILQIISTSLIITAIIKQQIFTKRNSTAAKASKTSEAATITETALMATTIPTTAARTPPKRKGLSRTTCVGTATILSLSKA